MAELHGIYQRSLGAKDDFLGRVIPVSMGDVNIGDWRDRVEHANYWKAEFQAMEAHWQELGAEDYRLYKAVRSWHIDVGDMLATICDLLLPDGLESITAEEFKGLRSMLRLRGKAGTLP